MEKIKKGRVHELYHVSLRVGHDVILLLKLRCYSFLFGLATGTVDFRKFVPMVEKQWRLLLVVTII